MKTWPVWAQRHIVLGLDLQGGSHLLLEVDSNDVRRRSSIRCATMCRGVLREAAIGYTGGSRARPTRRGAHREGSDAGGADQAARAVAAARRPAGLQTGQRSLEVERKPAAA